MRTRITALACALLVVVVLTPWLLAHADSGFDGALFGDTNNDRVTACGRPAFGWSDTMAGIAQQRAQEIADSGNFTNKLEMSYGAENIGWTSGPTDQGAAAAQVNDAYMNSAEHRANICDPRWNVVGIGSVYRDQWNGKSQVWIDAEEFTGTTGAVTPPIAPSHNNANAAPGISVPGTGGAR